MEKDQPGVSLLFYGERSAWCKFTVPWREVCLVQVYCSMERGHPGVSLLFYGGEVCLVQVYCSMERDQPGVSLLFYGER